MDRCCLTWNDFVDSKSNFALFLRPSHKFKSPTFLITERRKERERERESESLFWAYKMNLKNCNFVKDKKVSLRLQPICLHNFVKFLKCFFVELQPPREREREREREWAREKKKCNDIDLILAKIKATWKYLNCVSIQLFCVSSKSTYCKARSA